MPGIVSSFFNASIESVPEKYLTSNLRQFFFLNQLVTVVLVL